MDVYLRLKTLCEEKGETITNLCVEITGNKGNLATWKTGSIRNDYLVKIAAHFDVTTDYLLGEMVNPADSERILNFLFARIGKDKDFSKNSEIQTAIGLDTLSIRNWKKGVSYPSFNDVVKIANYFKITTDHLLGRTETKTALNEQSLSLEHQELIEKMVSLTPDDLSRVRGYIDSLSEK